MNGFQEQGTPHEREGVDELLTFYPGVRVELVRILMKMSFIRAIKFD